MSPAEIDALRPGIRLRVPFGSRELTGYLLSVEGGSEVAAESLKPALAVLDPEPLVDAELLRLCHWAADYYQHPLGEVYSALFPRRLREGGALQPVGNPGFRLTTRGKGLPEGALSGSPRQAQALALLQKQGEVANTTFRASGINASILRKLADQELVEPCVIGEHSRPAGVNGALDLNREQAAAFEAVTTAGEGFCCHLLEGVTGSGKTEVYLQLIADCIERGKQALVLIPEIGLTPQTLARFRARFDAEIAVLHSGLTDAQRYIAWESARSGRAHIVIGTRSAVFTPLAAPGLVIIDEEHDSSYKQQDRFRYSARDVAVKRAQIHNCPILLGSATPSLESLQNAINGRYQHLQLTRRAGSGEMPELRALDIRRQALHGGLSADLLTALEETLRRGQQVLLFLNRRGYAPTLQCHDCGWIAECPACDARLTIHRRKRRLRCHHCGGANPLPEQCPGCHSGRLMSAGLGTEQTEEFLLSRFDNWPIHRVDSDSMQGREAMQSLVDEINRGEPCILLGTQMLTKGHHFPGVALVAVIDADTLLFSADFRGEERMAQLLTQVAGRAGRAGHPGVVLLQTHYPDHPALVAMISQSYSEQAMKLLELRRESGMPPAGFLVVLRTDCPDADNGERFLQDLRQRCATQLPTGTRLIGPLPSPMQRRAGKYRAQLLLAAASRKGARAAAHMLVANAEQLPARRGLNWTIDVDPQDLF
jgi:primosomal protein N' (replication factor Y)